VAVLLCVVPLTATPSVANAASRRAPQGTNGGSIRSTTARASESPSALVVFVEPADRHRNESLSDAFARELATIPTLSTGLLSATQGSYATAQMLLDITQGARVSNSTYDSPLPPLLQVPVAPAATTSRGTPPSAERALAVGEHPRWWRSGVLDGAQAYPWPKVLERVHGAPQLLEPGLLASQVRGGAAYVPAAGVGSEDGLLAAGRNGHIAAVPIGPSSVLAGIERVRASNKLVVADLGRGTQGYTELRALAAKRPPRELLIVMERTAYQPGNHSRRQPGLELMWVSFAGLGPGQRTLTSQTTNQNGLVSAIDIAPTILNHLGLAVPQDMRGKPIHTDGPLHIASLRALKARLGVISSRRLPALAWLIATWVLLLAVACLPIGGNVARKTRGAWARRTGALAVLWLPAAELVPAAIEPTRTAEFALLVGLCFALAALTDRLLPWPRAPLAPAVAAVLALSIDALAGTQLLIRSLLGPNPILGARFYGIGNELKSGLAVLVFAAVAAWLYPATRSRRTASAMAGAGILLAIVEGSARIGAGVGGVILVSAGTAVATVMLLPGGVNRKRVLVVMAAPVLALVGLAALDLLTAHGSGHFTGSILDARSASDIRDVIERRYGAAWDELRNHLMPLATAVALLLSGLAVWQRERVLSPVASDPAWVAALSGGLTAGIVGALSEDSGPVLLVVAVLMLGCVLSYLWGKPAEETLTRHNPGTRPAARSRALRRSAAPSR
jgi:hypothetical protein